MKYTLKKIYPSIPTDWKMGMEVEKNRMFGFYSNVNKSYSPLSIVASNIENFPEYWEKVVEYHFEIRSFIANTTFKVVKKGDILRRNDKMFTNGTIYAREEELLITQIWDIHSVKRLSDGELFTLHDEIRVEEDETLELKFKHFPIHRIQLAEDDILFTSEKGQIVTINNCERDPIIFFTEDGVGIREGDYFYMVEHEKISGPIIASESTIIGETPGNVRFFGKKEKAESYLYGNARILTLNEVLEHWHKNDSLLEFVKQKLEDDKSIHTYRP